MQKLSAKYDQRDRFVNMLWWHKISEDFCRKISRIYLFYQKIPKIFVFPKVLLKIFVRQFVVFATNSILFTKYFSCKNRKNLEIFCENVRKNKINNLNGFGKTLAKFRQNTRNFPKFSIFAKIKKGIFVSTLGCLLCDLSDFLSLKMLCVQWQSFFKFFKNLLEKSLFVVIEREIKPCIFFWLCGKIYFLCSS